MPIRAVIFDAYGTLFDVAGAARLAAAEPGGEAPGQTGPKRAADWRRKQFEYSWLRAITGKRADFAKGTQDVLDWVMETAGLSNHALQKRLTSRCDPIDLYPDASGVMERLDGAGPTPTILSNGTQQILEAR